MFSSWKHDNTLQISRTFVKFLDQSIYVLFCPTPLIFTFALPNPAPRIFTFALPHPGPRIFILAPHISGTQPLYILAVQNQLGCVHVYIVQCTPNEQLLISHWSLSFSDVFFFIYSLFKFSKCQLMFNPREMLHSITLKPCEQDSNECRKGTFPDIFEKTFPKLNIDRTKGPFV